MQLCQQAILNKDIETLKEVILKFRYFEELQQFLSEHQLNSLLQHISFQFILRREPLVLQSEITYFFFEAGLIRQRDLGGKSSKSIRSTKNKSWITTTSKMCSREKEYTQSLVCRVQPYDSYEDIQINKGKYVQNVYQNCSGKPALALTLSLEVLPEYLSNKIRQQSQQKVKFLSQCLEMKGIHKNSVIEKQHKFKYLKLKFGQILYGNGIRPQQVFLMKRGQLEVFLNGKKGNSFMVSLTKTPLEYARCISQKVQCYQINRENLLHCFPSLVKHESLTPIIPLSAATSPIVRSPFGSTHSHRNDAPSVEQTSFTYSTNRRHDQSLPKRKLQHISEEDKIVRVQRAELLRQRMPNFFNQLYGKYSERKMRQIGITGEYQQNINLYNMKVLERKHPDMGEIHSKLKKRRLQQIILCKGRLEAIRHRQQSSEVLEVRTNLC